MLSRRTRCRRASGPTADDAVLTLKILVAVTSENCGGHTYETGEDAKAEPRAGLANGSINEAAEPNIHHQADGHKNKQRGGTPVAHERQGDTSHRHSTDDHGHIDQNVKTKRSRHAHDQKHTGAVFGALGVLY